MHLLLLGIWLWLHILLLLLLRLWLWNEFRVVDLGDNLSLRMFVKVLREKSFVKSKWLYKSWLNLLLFLWFVFNLLLRTLRLHYVEI